MEGDVLGVRVNPQVIQFFNTKPRTCAEINLTVRNVSSSSKSIRLYGPKLELRKVTGGPFNKDSCFALKVKNPEEPVAPGLSVTAVVLCESSIEREEKDRIIISVDGNILEVPIYSYPSQPVLDIDKEVDFGTVVTNSKVVAREITVTNTGSKPGRFELKYSGYHPIAIVPNQGLVPANSETKIKIEYVTKNSGKFNEEAEVFMDGRDPLKLLIRGNVIERSLELLSLVDNTTKVTCIRFGNTYYGTDLTECALLFNNGPEPVSFVAVLDENAVAQELGVDFTQTTAASLAVEKDPSQKNGHTNEIISLVTAIPNQGVLKPYQKVPIFFKFSPRWHYSKQGWKNSICPPPRKDFALYMRLQIIGASSGFSSDQNANAPGSHLEVALTGTALPVLMNISPSVKYDFGECPVGEHADVLCTIRNESKFLPALFEFRRVAHFSSHPPNGKIFPGQTQDVIISFAPKKVGTFKPDLCLDVIGEVADKSHPANSHAEVIYTLPIKLHGTSDPVTTVPKPKFNPGITPLITNEVGLNINTTFKNLNDNQPRMAMNGAKKTKLHHLVNRNTKSADHMKETDSKVAFPNDRAQSIRPFDRKEKYQTLFTRTDRYNYIDSDYSYDDLEIEKKKKHDEAYSQTLYEQKEKWIAKQKMKEFLETNNPIDIGLKSASGIKPKKLKQDEIKTDPPALEAPNSQWKLLSTKELAALESEATSKPVCEGLNAIPTTDVEKKECSWRLTPQQLHQIIVGPPVIDFGKVCVGSVCHQELNIVNNLDQYIHVVAEIDCTELRQSCPLSQVVPPHSKAVIPVIFESRTKGKFQRSVLYTVNGFFKHHVTVLAEVCQIALELSTNKIVLKPQHGMPAEAGYRGVITLYNRLNYPAEFTWLPNLTEKGTAFSIRPASGVVDPESDLDCEIVWHSSYSAPEEGSFTLSVNGGDSSNLVCKAELGTTNVYFLDQRISFGIVPVNLTSVGVGILHNAGNNHAYFQISDPNPLPGLSVSPVQGVVPVGGSAEIHVALNSDSILKFDTKIHISIKGGKSLELRIGGSVEAPVINFDVSAFSFGGVYCGSTAVMPFQLYNKSNIKCKVELDFTRYKDFAISFPGFQTEEDTNFHLLNPDMYSVTLDPLETIDGEMTFTPTQVAAYDFVLPLTINQLNSRPGSTPCSSSSYRKSSKPGSVSSTVHIIQPKPVQPCVDIPCRHVIATALRQPLKLSATWVEFLLPLNFLAMPNTLSAETTKTLVITNKGHEKMTWGLDLSQPNKHLDNGTFKFLHERGIPFITQGETRGIEGQIGPGQSKIILINFSPDSPGRYEVKIPVVINSNWAKPFQFLELFGQLESPKVWFNLPRIELIPVPLSTETYMDFLVCGNNYRKKNSLTVTCPEILWDDTITISPLTVTFPQGSEIKPCDGSKPEGEPWEMPCRVTFISSKPVSFCQSIVFFDQEGQKFSLPIFATADNCILTCFYFLESHRVDHQIVCEEGTHPKGRKALQKVNYDSPNSGSSGEALLVPCVARNNSRPSTSATSSNFQISSSNYESSTSVTDSSISGTPRYRDGATNRPPMSKETSALQLHFDRAYLTRDLEGGEGGEYIAGVLSATQRWFSSQGWPGGPYPMSIPETLRSSISKKIATDTSVIKEETVSKVPIRGSKKQKAKTGFNKMAKTIYDMISFLSGRPVPGIPINSPLPADPLERVKQIYWQHCTLLTFLRCQGASVASIDPEFLMAPADYLLWRQLQFSVKKELLRQGNDKEAETVKILYEVDEENFEFISQRMWLDVLLQILKVLVLAKVTPKTLKALSTPYKDISMPIVNPDPLASNIYGVPERILLAWMNHYYETYRAQIWQDCTKGGVPPARWIVNFDYDLMDGLVLGAVLGAHLPFLIESHLKFMYTHPVSAEQCLHNALKVISGMRLADIDYDIQAIDITDPNPIAMLLLLVNLYHRLPHYVPKATIEFVGDLHTTVSRQVKVNNSSVKSLVYHVLLAGPDARDFNVQKGNLVTVSPKSTLTLTVDFKSRFMRHADALLILVGRRYGATMGNTLSFKLTTDIDVVKAKVVVKVESPCYEMKKFTIDVVNPFHEAGEFLIALVESSSAVESFHENNMATSKEKPGKSTAQKKPGDQLSDAIPLQVLSSNIEASNQKTSQIPKLKAFFLSSTSIYLEAQGSVELEVCYLPFTVEERQCSIIFVNDQIGEFLYSIEGTALQPLPSYLPYVPSKNSVRISSAAAAGTGRGMFGGDDAIIYWKCEAGITLKEVLKIPITNAARERALMLASQQHMSDLEIQRRAVAGTLSTCSVKANTIKHISNNPDAFVSLAKSIGPVADVFRVEIDSDFFKVPNILVMPASKDGQGKCLPNIGDKADVDEEKFALLPIEFRAREAGHYSTTITLKSFDDIRVYRIECTVVKESNIAELEFSSPVHQVVSQDIPIVNMTDTDWNLKATITGNGFSGPSELLAKAYTTSYYPLKFRPMKEGEVNGSLVLTNQMDGTDQTFIINGIGLRPLALDHIKLICAAKASIAHSVNVPNVTKKKLTYKVESDLPFISGPQHITALPNQTCLYTFNASPKKRGTYKGVLVFTARTNIDKDVDSDGEEYSHETDNADYLGYRLWYALSVDVKPSLPERTINITCACQKKTVMEVIVRNPTPQELTLAATITGYDLSGPPSITLQPGAKDVYALTFAPAMVQETKGSLLFYNETVGEFWYELILKSDPPVPITLPPLECELGKWTTQMIKLQNPTMEVLELIPVITNSNNFALERDLEKPIILKGKCTIEVPLRFMPTNLGYENHMSRIIFQCRQLKEWIFIASGSGLIPRPQPPVSVHTATGSNTTVIIPFRNPTDVPVMVDVLLTDTEQASDKLFDGMPAPDPAFKLLLKHNSSIIVEAKSTLEIPISFAPTEMINYKAFCTVAIRREDGQQWPYVLEDTLGNRLSITTSGLNKIRWLYPIVGIPEHKISKDATATHIICQARDQVEQRMEVVLSGCAPGANQAVSLRAKTPKDKKSKSPQGVVVGNTMATANEFSFELVYPNDEVKEKLSSAVAISITRHYRDPSSGLVTLIFTVRYAPIKIMDYIVQFHVRAATGGLWRFPLRFSALEPPVDDTVMVEATGLGKPSSVGFRLTSMQKEATEFTAFFESGSDPEFTVSPETGELLPVDTPGTLFTVNFLPTVYGKLYHAKLVVQTSDMQWSYMIKGVLPEYKPPRGVSAPPISGPHPELKKQHARRNYIRENMRLIATAVSSPIKGAPLMNMTHKQQICV
ncbi:cilia and flagella-associated protein 47-like isoform X1 [Biomphalaria glabrata]|uniref:Cilia and flagella-associated protein 47-like isoform X1 n=1 Tax=Biomphalaria glabrata TaxID=6526 RepID=A0A9W3ALM5_BIOGL|nr:cilia and flagella-associated protein 47-like isoform X1 [Biomphalaria glabrata]